MCIPKTKENLRKTIKGKPTAPPGPRPRQARAGARVPGKVDRWYLATRPKILRKTIRKPWGNHGNSWGPMGKPCDPKQTHADPCEPHGKS